MSKWPGKYVIGLTGNIATGKSVVRKMLEHLGAYGIDADALGHRAMAQKAPGFEAVLDYFGRWILGSDGHIDRKKLGSIVFSDPEAMATLEAIIHPLVGEAIDFLITRSKHEVIVIEAIKLLEGELRNVCDAIWVTHVSEDIQLERLIRKRNLSLVEARARIRAQPSQGVKISAAHVVINNERSFEDAWKQVLAAWRVISDKRGPVLEAVDSGIGGLAVMRAGPRQAGQIAELITRLSKGEKKMSTSDVMEAFGEKAYMLLIQDSKISGVVGWQVENLISRITDFFLAPGVRLRDAAASLMKAVDTASSELQSEASLLFLPREVANQTLVWQALGYERRSVDDLKIRAWQEAARESYVDGSELLFKQLRVDRVMRPI